jgi:hypothetical protein
MSCQDKVHRRAAGSRNYCIQQELTWIMSIAVPCDVCPRSKLAITISSVRAPTTGRKGSMWLGRHRMGRRFISLEGRVGRLVGM